MRLIRLIGELTDIVLKPLVQWEHSQKNAIFNGPITMEIRIATAGCPRKKKLPNSRLAANRIDGLYTE